MLLVMIHHHPLSPLFPYTTLFRSDQTPDKTATVTAASTASRVNRPSPLFDIQVTPRILGSPPGLSRPEPRPHEDRARSEEHTSELQSRQYLVCRLLLEQKAITNVH